MEGGNQSETRGVRGRRALRSHVVDTRQIHRRGVIGESAAETYLLCEKKMLLLHRNWRSGKEEIDLIMMDDEVLVFVEVRSRQQTALVPGFHSLDKRKRLAMRRACTSFLRQHPRQYSHFRLDVVEVNLCDEEITEIIHFENIPIFGKFQGN